MDLYVYILARITTISHNNERDVLQEVISFASPILISDISSSIRDPLQFNILKTIYS